MASGKRLIVVVTGTRAEFGLLEPVIRGLHARPEVRVALIVTGVHLTSGTWREVAGLAKELGGVAVEKVAMQRARGGGRGGEVGGGETGRSADVAAVGRGVAGIGRVLDEMKPGAVVVLGDRIEAFAGAAAASIGGYPLAHIHGGDRAEGVADEAMRHAISKLAHVHFAASAQSRQRLIRMGEDRRMVFNTGSPAMDGLGQIEAAVDGPTVIVLQHPIGADDEQERLWMSGTLAATRRFSRLVMMPNGDAGRAGIVEAIARERMGRGGSLTVVDHLPRERWLGLVRGAKVIVGNSSAGLIEACGLRTACVNVGPRQGGRQRPGHVIDCDYGAAHVAAAIDQAMKLDLRRLRNPYGDGTAGQRIAKLLATMELGPAVLRKRNSY